MDPEQSPGDASLDLSVRMTDGTGLVTLSGELDIGSAPRLGETLDWLCDRGCRQVVVDLSGVSFVDSSGLAAFVRAHQRLAQTGGRLTLSRPGHSLRRLLSMTGLAGEFHIE